MKTPREVLLKRHQNAESKLDTIREQVVQDLVGTRRRSRPSTSVESGRERRRVPTLALVAEFLLPLRWHLAGMSALWVMVALLNSEPAAVSPAVVAKETTPEPPQLLAAVRENRRQILELIDGSLAQSVTAPQSFVPRPRSERRSECETVV